MSRSGTRIAAAVVPLATMATGCAFLGGGAPGVICAGQAVAYEGEVVASVASSVGAVRALVPQRGSGPAAFAGLAAEHRAVVCYIDGRIAKSPPGGRPFDRPLVVVVDGQATLVQAGYRDRLPVEAP